MVLNQGKELGRTIAKQQKQIDELKQNINPNDPAATFPLFTQERVIPAITVVARKRIYDTTSFIIDHPTLGDIDSATLNIDGGYDTGDPEDNTVIISESF